ncbi:MAG: hypothetical protein AABZ55_02100, partial [Bdellovibrionota bacterium]
HKLKGAQSPTTFIANVAGTLHFENETNEFRFKLTYSIEPTEEETATMIAAVKAQNPTLSSVRKLPSQFGHAQVLTCLDILSNQKAGAGFIFQNLLAANVVFFGTVGMSEILGSNRLHTDRGIQVLEGDLIANNVTTAINSLVRRSITMENPNLLKSLGMRYLNAGAQITGERFLIFPYILDENAEERANNIAKFESGYYAVRVPIQHIMDKLIVHDLPNRIYESCAKGNSLRVLVSPTMIRIYDSVGWSLIYYQLRNKTINE